MYEVVLIGGGYTSVWAYRGLLRSCRRAVRTGRLRITIVAPGGEHRFHGWTGEYLSGLMPERRVATPIAEICPLANAVDGVVSKVSVGERMVHVGSERLRYDVLVLGAGSADRGDVPGMRELALSPKEPEQCRELRSRIASWQANDPDALDERAAFAVVGGGLAGAEMSAAIAESLAGKGRVVLVHSGATLLPELTERSPGLAWYARQRLRDHGVEVRTGRAVDEVTATGLSLSDGTKVNAATVVTTLGQRPVVLPGTEDLPRDDDGRLRTSPGLQVAGHPELFAGGDVASVRRPLTDGPCPANALWAIKHGTRIGINVGRVFRGRQPRRFRYPGLGVAASFGRGQGIVRLYRLPMRGWLAWVMRAVFFLRFMPSRPEAGRTIPDLARIVRNKSL